MTLPLVPTRHSTLLHDLNTRDQVAVVAQKHDADAKELAALQAARADLISKGVLPGAIPEVTSAMSAPDRAALANRIAGLAQAHSAGGKAATAAKTTTTATSASTGAAVLDKGRKDLGLPAVSRAPAGNTPLATPGATPTPAPGGKTPLEQALATVPNHLGMTVDARQTGAGMVTTVPGGTGPRAVGARDVGVNPTFEQTMHAKTGGKWGSMKPEERAAWLRSNPAPGPLNSDNEGVVTDTGKSPTDYRGVTTIQTPNGVVQETIPGQDKLYSKGGVASRENTLRGIEQRYGAPAPGTIRYPKASVPVTSPAGTPVVAASPTGETSENEHANPATTGSAEPMGPPVPITPATDQTSEMEHTNPATTGASEPVATSAGLVAGQAIRGLPVRAAVAAGNAITGAAAVPSVVGGVAQRAANPIVQGVKDFVSGITGRPISQPPVAAPPSPLNPEAPTVAPAPSPAMARNDVNTQFGDSAGNALPTEQNFPSLRNIDGSLKAPGADPKLMPVTPGLPDAALDANGNMIRKPVFKGVPESTFATKPGATTEQPVPSAVDNPDTMHDFLQNEHDDQFKKGLKFQGFSDGV